MSYFAYWGGFLPTGVIFYLLGMILPSRRVLLGDFCGQFNGFLPPLVVVWGLGAATLQRNFLVFVAIKTNHLRVERNTYMRSMV